MQNKSVLDWPKGTTVYHPERCYNGYTIINPFLSRTIYLVNMRGNVVHQWPVTGSDERGKSIYSIFLEKQRKDDLMSLHWRDPDSDPKPAIPQFEIVQRDWDGNILWRYSPPAGVSIHHDVERLESGNTVILGWELREDENVSDCPFQDSYFKEIDIDGNVVWSWYTSEHIDDFDYPSGTRDCMRSLRGDIFHDNTVTVLPGNDLGTVDPRFRKGNILGSQRHLGLIYIVDRASGKVVWQWGTGSGQLVGQHHPTMLANGNILVYDNGGQCGYPPRHRPKTRLVEINPSTNSIVWEYGYEYNMRSSSKFFGSSWGSAQRLPNGNTLSLDTHSGRVFEVTAFGEIVWEYINPFPWSTHIGGHNIRETEYGMYRVFRYAYGEFPLANSWYKYQDGNGARAAGEVVLRPGMGLPSTDLA